MPTLEEYTIGWICALKVEFVAAKSFLDRNHEFLEEVPLGDDNVYALGEIHGHNVVIAVLPDGEYGTVPAAITAKDMTRTFTNMQYLLLVGIGSGAPSIKNDIRLGDVVVSIAGNGTGGVIAYDVGRLIQDQGFQRTGFLNQPPHALRAAVNQLQVHGFLVGFNHLEEAIEDVLSSKPRMKKNYQRPHSSTDILYRSNYVATFSLSEDENNTFEVVQRPPRDHDENLQVHHGTIASANSMLRDALIRDKFSAEHDILCFDMEAAGLMNNFSCLVIRGICDYADTHNYKKWQGYAAMTAAAYAKHLLIQLAPSTGQDSSATHLMTLEREWTTQPDIAIPEPEEFSNVEVAEVFADVELEPHDGRRVKTADAFWSEMEKFRTKSLLPPRPGIREWTADRPPRKRRIRIAVIDTGVDFSDPLVKPEVEKGRITGKSWVGEDSTDYNDTCGHGTHLVRLILKTNKTADILVAKVSDNENFFPKSTKNMAEAIGWAAQENASIISLSWGFKKENAVIKAALDRVIRPRSGNTPQRLIFAAAGNWGFTHGVAYPARERGVFCVHAVDGNGYDAQLSPKSDRKAKSHPIATLGVAVRSLKDGAEVWLSGTSFATPIAAALAANALEFALRNMPLDDYMWRKLTCFPAMKGIMELMSMEGNRADTGYLAPWRLLEEGQDYDTNDKLCNEFWDIISCA